MRPFAQGNNQSQKAPGVTDTIAAGLTEVLMRPWLMVLPILLDLYYWIGWRLLPSALTARIARVASDELMFDKRSNMNWLRDVGKLDLSGMLGLTVPSMLVGIDRENVYEIWTRPTIVPDSYLIVGLITVLFFLAASLCSMTFLVPLADVVSGRKRPWRQLPRAVGVAWLRVLGLQTIVFGLIALVFGPIVVMTAVFAYGGVDVTGLAQSLGVMSALPAIVFLWFVLAAIAAAEVGPFRAIYLSVNVVRRNFWQTVGLITASILIGSGFFEILVRIGLPELWVKIVDTPPGLLVAVVAHAYFAVSLAIASLIFFTDRLRLLRFDAAPRAFPVTRRSAI